MFGFNSSLSSFDTAKLGYFSAACSLFCVFLLRLFDHKNEFWPKPKEALQILAKALKVLPENRFSVAG